MPYVGLFTELRNLINVNPFTSIGILVSADKERIAKRYRRITNYSFGHLAYDDSRAVVKTHLGADYVNAYARDI